MDQSSRVQATRYNNNNHVKLYIQSFRYGSDRTATPVIDPEQSYFEQESDDPMPDSFAKHAFLPEQVELAKVLRTRYQ